MVHHRGRFQMRSQATLALCLISLAPAGLTAQITRAIDATIESCALADSLLGHQTGIPGHVMSMSLPDSSLNLSTRPKAFMRGATGVVEFGGSLHFLPSDPSLPPFQLFLKVISPRPRPLPERQLILILDDTLTIDAGSMTAGLQHWPGVTDAVENMIVSLPFYRLTQIGQAEQVEGRLGATRFTVSRSQHDNLKALLVGGLCHQAIADGS